MSPSNKPDDGGRPLMTAAGRFGATRLEAGSASAEILTGLGGVVRQIALLAPPGSGDATAGHAIELLDACPARELSADRWFRGRILCPFNDRIPRGRYRWRGRELRLAANSFDDDSAIHGLVYDRPFEVVSDASRLEPRRRGASGEGAPAPEACLHLETEWPADAFPGYPFALRLDLFYRLTETQFALEFTATNRGDEAAPFAFGWHPYFTLDRPIDELTLASASAELVPVDDSLMPTGKLLTVTGSEVDFRAGRLIGDQVIDLALTAPADRRVTLSSPERAISLHLTGESFRYIQLFTPPGRRSIAIEPVTAATNAFNLPSLGLRTIEPGASLTGGVEVGFDS